MTEVKVGYVDPAIHAQGIGMAYSGRGHGCRVEFEVVAKKHEAKSKEAGKPVFINLEYIRITPPGGETRCRPVWRKDREETYAREYAQWKEQGEVPMEGYPLKEWGGITASEIALCTYRGIKTVEQLAELPDSLLENIGHNAINLRRSAQAFLEAQEDAAIPAAVAAENEKLKEELVKQGQMIASLMQENEKENDGELPQGKAPDLSPPKKKRGRPRKNPLTELTAV